MDLHHSGKPVPDRDPHQSETLDTDPDPHQSQNSGAAEAQNKTVEGLGSLQWMRGCSEWSLEGSADQWPQIRITWMMSRFRIHIQIRINVMRIWNCSLCSAMQLPFLYQKK
jgi:hypothetical protein